MIIAGQQQHAAVARSAGGVGMLQRVSRAVQTRALAIPQGKYAIAIRALEQVELLRAPDGVRGQLFIHAGLEDDVVCREVRPGLAESQIESGQWRTAVAGDVTGGIQTGAAIAFLLQHGQTRQRLVAGDVDAALRAGVFVFEADVAQRRMLRGCRNCVHGATS